MSQYILDTDCVTLFQNDHPVVVRRVNANRPNVVVTIITVEEQIRGRFNVIRRTSQGSQLELLRAAYTNLEKTLQFFCRIKLLNFSEEAAAIYTDLRRQKIRIGTQDLRIASIVLATEGGVLITRNQRDFSRVPGLAFEDWTR